MKALWLAVLAACVASDCAAEEVIVDGWKVVVCTFHAPDFMEGQIKTIYFREVPQAAVWSGGPPIAAAINDAEIAFTMGQAQWRISRITGQFSLSIKAGFASGVCIPGNQKKF